MCLLRHDHSITLLSYRNYCIDFDMLKGFISHHFFNFMNCKCQEMINCTLMVLYFSSYCVNAEWQALTLMLWCIISYSVNAERWLSLLTQHLYYYNSRMYECWDTIILLRPYFSYGMTAERGPFEQMLFTHCAFFLLFFNCSKMLVHIYVWKFLFILWMLKDIHLANAVFILHVLFVLFW